jgi:hypothetical protein
MMDCNTARLILELAGGAELDAIEARALEEHLAVCPECDARASAARRFDQAVRAAMLHVDPPEGIRDRLLEGMRTDGQAHRQRRLRRSVRWAAAAAAAVLLGLGGWCWYAMQRTEVNPAEVWRYAAFDRPGRAEVEASFARMGVQATAPELDYSYLTAYGLAELPGKPGRTVPQLVFRREVPGPFVCAVVWVLDTHRFSISEFEPPSGSPYKIELLQRPGDRYAYLVYHNGDDLDWLKPAESRAA